MPVEKSLGLAQKLKECENIARLYSKQTKDDPVLSQHYKTLADGISKMHYIHTDSFTMTYIEVIGHVHES